MLPKHRPQLKHWRGSFSPLCALLLLLLVVAVALPFAFGASLEQLLLAAAQAYKQRQYTQAEVLTQTALRQQPRSQQQLYQAYYILGLSQVKLGKLAKAKDALSMATQFVPPHSEQQQKLMQVVKALASSSIKTNAPTTETASTPKQSPNHNSQTLMKANAQLVDKHYLEFATHDGEVMHWNPQAMPIKVYINDGYSAGNWDPSSNAIVRQAWNTWTTQTQGMVTFKEVASKKEADIVVQWTHALSHDKLGVSPFMYFNGKLLQADVLLATHKPSSDIPMSRAEVLAVCVHEFGHALGIQGHSPDPNDVMYWASREGEAPRTKLSSRDVTTLKLLYNMKATVTNATDSSVKQVAAAYTHAQKASDAFGAKQYTTAYSEAKLALAESPNDVALLSLGGSAAVATRNYAQAELWLKQGLAKTPNDAVMNYNMALAKYGLAEKQLKANQVTPSTLQKLEETLVYLDKTPASDKIDAQTMDSLRNEAQRLLRLLRPSVAFTPS